MEQIKNNGLMSEKHKKLYIILNHFEHFLISVPAISGSVSIYTFASSVGVTVGITSFAVGLKIGAITAGINKYISTIKKKRTISMII